MDASGENEKGFRKAYVAYLDILGFKKMIQNTPLKVINIMEKLNDVISEYAQSVDGNRRHPNALHMMFSDSIVIFVYDKIDTDYYSSHIKGLRQLIYCVKQLQSVCAEKDVWLRGAISLGDIYFTDNNVAGEGLVKAIELEKSVVFPRVILDPRIARDVYNFSNDDLIREIDKHAKDKMKQGMIKEFEGHLMINYLDGLEDESLKEIQVRIKKHIQNQDADAQVRCKFYWVAEYLRHLKHSNSQN